MKRPLIDTSCPPVDVGTCLLSLEARRVQFTFKVNIYPRNFSVSESQCRSCLPQSNSIGITDCRLIEFSRVGL